MTPARWLDIVRLRLRSLFRRSRVERDLDRELALHLDLQMLGWIRPSRSATCA